MAPAPASASASAARPQPGRCACAACASASASADVPGHWAATKSARRGLASKSKSKANQGKNTMAAKKEYVRDDAAVTNSATRWAYKMLLAEPAPEGAKQRDAQGKLNWSEEKIAANKAIVDKFARLRNVQSVREDRQLMRREVLMDAALEALPTPELKKECVTDPGFPMPLHRQIFTWTPPREI